ncbi:MAG: bifunctional heptose 7-phosphate kinase/heptose 1-phosphate adenyltransferase [Pyrinomonadaceae bacterium]
MINLQSAIKTAFPQKCVVIVGDLVADQFLNGTISRVSREAPVFILRHDNTVTLPGAAANAAANVAALGGKPILIGLAGNDANGELLLKKLDEIGVAADKIVTDTSVSTTTKVRVLAGQHYAARQQVIRIDYENSACPSDQLKEKLCKNLIACSARADAIIISDYNCGAVSPEIYETARTISSERRIPLIVDSRYKLSDFPNATTGTPNREEVEKILGANFSVEDCAALRERLGYEALLVTNGNEGMLLFVKDKPTFHIDAVGSKEPVDVTGAGDTVIAAYTLGLASGLNFADAAKIANHAGGIVVMKKGTATVGIEELCESLATDADPLMSRGQKV